MRPIRTAIQLHRRLVLFFMAAVILTFSFAPAATTAVNAQTTSNACALPDNLVTGQSNWAVAGLGSWSVVGLGSWSVVGLSNWSVAGLGNWSVAGLGNWSVAGLGNWSVAGLSWQDLVALLQEIQNNTIDKNWIQGFLPEIGPQGSVFNTVPVAVLVLDDFGGDDAIQHGQEVQIVLNDLKDSVNAMLPAGSPIKIGVYPVDISDLATGDYKLDGIVSALQNKMTQLEQQGYKHFVINMSFGALVPCQDSTIDIGGGETWNFQQFLQTSEGPQKIQPILECVADKGNGLYTAHFGYNSFNLEAVNIPVGNNNTFGSPANRFQVQVFQPGRQKDLFRVDFDGSPITWTVQNGTYVASAIASAANNCAPDPVNTTATITPLVTCIAVNPDPAGNGKAPYRAYFGYFNQPENGAAVRIAAGENNRFSPAPWQDVGQTRVFEPGHVPFAFEVDFYGGQITWTVETLNGVRSATAQFNTDTPLCPFYPMFGDSLGLIQYLIMKGAPTGAFQQILTGLDDNDADLAPLANLLQDYENRSATDKYFRAVSMASSGNYARNYPDPYAAPPLWPAKLDTTIAVAASLGNDPNQWWLGSHLGNVMAPGAWYNILSDELDYNAFVSGTSFAAPHASMVAALWLTHPNACNFGTEAAPQRPLKGFAMDLTNDPFIAATVDGSGMPLDCVPDFPPVAEDDAVQTTYDVPVTINVLANDSDATAVSNVSAPSNGTATINADQTVTYDPNANFPPQPGSNGVDTFMYQASDGLLTDNAQVWVEVARLDLTQSCNAGNVVLSVANPMTQLGSTPPVTFAYAVNGVQAGTASVDAGGTTTLPLSFTPGTTISISVGGIAHDTFTAASNPCEPKIGYFFVVDSETNQVIPIYDPYDPILQNQIIDLSVVPSHKINIVAVVEPSTLDNRTPAYVEFYINGSLFSTQTQACSDTKHGNYLYALAGHINCDYDWWQMQPGTQVTLQAIPYDSDGHAGTSLSITFTPVEGQGKGKK